VNPQLTVLGTGIAVVTDLGRTHGPGLGLAVGGALDQYSARVANILAANDERAALIEVTAFDFSFSVDADVLIAVTGAEMELVVGDVERPMWEPVSVRAGERVELSGMRTGMRTYVAVHGSFDAPRLLGSVAPDTVIGFGGSLAEGDRVALNASTVLPPNPYFGMSLFNFDVDRPYFGGTTPISVMDGPDLDEFAGTARRLFDRPYRVTEQSNHIGLRLAGPLPVRTSTGEVLSRGVPIGAVEVPPGDELLILHRGRGVTAGYPVLGVVTSTSLDALGQVRPGELVSLRPIDVDQASRDARAWRARLDTLRSRARTVFACLGIEARDRHGEDPARPR